MTSDAARQAQLEAWGAVADGWERRRDVIWEATRSVSARLVELLDPAPGQSLLEVAAGPGDTGLLAAPLLLPGGRLLSTDGVPDMVEAARRRAAKLGAKNVDFAVADAAELPLADASFDGALCRFGVMLVPDCVAAARELGRVVRPDGRVTVAVWAEGERNPWMTVTGRAALRLGLIQRPDPEAPGPFRLAAPGRLRQVVEQAGLTVRHEEEVDVIWRAASLDEWWAVALDTSRMLSVLVARLDGADVDRIRQASEERLEPFLADDGSLAVPGVARVALATPAP